MVERTAKLTLKEQLEKIPCTNFLHADRYDDAKHHILHIWDDAGNSYDIVASREGKILLAIKPSLSAPNTMMEFYEDTVVWDATAQMKVRLGLFSSNRNELWFNGIKLEPTKTLKECGLKSNNIVALSNFTNAA
jgi:hypothetical protein